MKLPTALVFTFLLAGCHSTTVLNTTSPQLYSKGDCSVLLFPTKAAALRKGQITEMCVVSGNSAPSFDHSVPGAIKKNIKHLCACGADKAYIQSSATGAMGGPSSVSMVGFDYK